MERRQRRVTYIHKYEMNNDNNDTNEAPLTKVDIRSGKT